MRPPYLYDYVLKAMVFIFPFSTVYILINVSFKKFFTFRYLLKKSCLEMCLRYIRLGTHSESLEEDYPTSLFVCGYHVTH